MLTVASISDLLAASRRGERIIDVRDLHEYVSGHVPGAESVPVPIVPLRLDEIRGNKPVWVICESGARSARVAGYLAGHGVNVTTVAGGTGAWRSAGLPVRTGASR